MKFKIITLGCKVNIYESEIMSELLLNNGFIKDEENPDIVIINTCSVTNMADAKSRKYIRSVKKDNKDIILVVVGCSSENHREELLDLDVDILLGNKNKSKIVDIIKKYLKTKKRYVYFDNDKVKAFEDMVVDKFRSHTRAFIKIQDGCNNYCSYCIIPYLRGNLRSKDINKVIEEANNLVNNNHKEIVLTGIHTGSYGRGLDYDLSDLLRELIKIDGLKRIRISSIEITEINDKFLEVLNSSMVIVDHLHIPLQSGSERILKLMNRKYTKDEYKNIINKIRSIRPNISISTDVIVGFPSESEDDFKECIDFCKEIKFSKIHVFPYSKRDGTVASKMSNQIVNSVKHERSIMLNNISKELELAYAKKFINEVVDVLVERVENNISEGLSSNYLRVYINEELKVNEIYNVKIIKVDNDRIEGVIIDD